MLALICFSQCCYLLGKFFSQSIVGLWITENLRQAHQSHLFSKTQNGESLIIVGPLHQCYG